MNRQTPAGKATVTLLCQVFGISRAAYYAAGKPRKASPSKVVRLPKRPPHASAEDVLAAIREVLAEEGAQAWGVRKVWAMIRRRGLRVSRKRVWALMHANGLVLARDREPGEVTRGHVSVPDPNRRLASDLTTTWTKRDATIGITLAIDCGCRSVLGFSVAKEQDAPTLLAASEQALKQAFGNPENVPDGLDYRTDHGPQFTGSDCEDMCKRWGIDHSYAPVGRPTGNAVVERVIRTLKEEVIWLRDWDSVEQVREAVAAWVVRYNTIRPHQALDYKTPAEYRAEKLCQPCLTQTELAA
jgi:transposase InsO family protein